MSVRGQKPRTFGADTPASELIRHRDEDGCNCGIRAAYDDYSANPNAKPTTYEVFELGVEILAEEERGGVS